MIPNLDRINYIKERNKELVVNTMWPHVHEKDKKDEHAEYLHSKNYYEWYFAVARYVKPSMILELGVRFGYSAMAMLMGVGTADYVGVDNECGETGSNAYAEEHLRAFTQGNIELIFADTQTLDRLPWYGQAPLIHVDANHQPPGLYRDLELVLPVWDRSGLIIVDDVIADRALYGAALVWLAQQKLAHRVIDTHQGMLLIYDEEVQ